MKIDPNSLTRHVGEAVSQGVAEIRNKTAQASEEAQKQIDQKSTESKEAAQKWGEASSRDKIPAARFIFSFLSRAKAQKHFNDLGFARVADKTESQIIAGFIQPFLSP